MHENAKILQLHHFSLDASWSTECRLTQLDIFTTFLVDVATLRRCNVVTLRRIYINEGKIKIEQHFLEPKSKNRTINSEGNDFSAQLKMGTPIGDSMDCL